MWYVCLAGMVLYSNGLVPVLLATEVFSLDFKQSAQQDPVTWLNDQGFEFYADAGKIQYGFSSRGLTLNTPKKLLAFISKDITESFNAQRIRIEWGVDIYPDGADWEKEIFRQAIGIVVFFGDEKFDSGSFFYPDASRFVALFLGEKEIQSKIYTPDVYSEAGRYYCQPCNNPTTKLIITDVNIKALYQKAFGIKEVPPVTQIAIGVDTRSTQGRAKAFLSEIHIFDAN